MNKFVAIIFPDEARAYEGVWRFASYREGSILLYGETVVVKDEAGKLSIREAKSAGGLQPRLAQLLVVFSACWQVRSAQSQD